jgi:predicted DCC family thiol-disulfide oxidoreductase YuxK
LPESASNPIILYDGVCGLCNGLNRFLLKRDKHDRFRFASLQSEFAASLLKQHGINAVDLDTVYVVVDHGQASERLLARSDAILHVLRQLGGIWNVFRLGIAVPKSLRDALYNVVARNRYRVFGKYDVCLMPEERYRRKFLDIVAQISRQD